MNVKTNVAKKVFQIIDRNFKKGVVQSITGLPSGTKEGIQWAKHFNKHTCRVSYSCMKNLGSKIAEHKNKVLRGKENSNEGGCNCQNAPCPVNGNCSVHRQT